MRRRLGMLAATLAAGAALAALVVFGLASGRASAGRAAPALPTQRLAGAPVTLQSMLAGAHGRGTLVLFWASWCGPCEHEAPEVERFANSPAGAGRIVGVDWSDALSGARSFIATHRWTFPNVRDGEGTIGNRYRISGLPSTFVLDAHGRIRQVLRGPQTQASLTAALRAVGA